MILVYTIKPYGYMVVRSIIHCWSAGGTGKLEAKEFVREQARPPTRRHLEIAPSADSSIVK